jgi:hypothetical protein
VFASLDTAEHAAQEPQLLSQVGYGGVGNELQLQRREAGEKVGKEIRGVPTMWLTRIWQSSSLDLILSLLIAVLDSFLALTHFE